MRSSTADLHRLLSEELHALAPLPSGRAAQDGLISALRNLVDNEMAGSFEQTTMLVDAGAEEAAKAVPEVTREVAYGATREAIRNAARHARGDVPNRPLELDVVVQSEDGLRLI